MDYNAITKTIDATIKWVDKQSSTRVLNADEKRKHAAFKTNLKDAQTIVKRVNHYGGIENLLKLSAKGSEQQGLFGTQTEK